jgi:hypothetical protein
MPARLLSLLTILVLTVGCAPGYYDTQPSYQPEATPKWYKNPETEQEYQRRIEWENFETEWLRFHRR